jgi:hypothetical protein
MRRSLVLLLVTAAALLLAGCTGKTDNRPAATSPPASASPTPPAASSSGSSLPPPTVPSGFTIKDAGDVQGTFDRAWKLHVASVGFRDALVDFNLTGLQDGAPPTARIHLSLQDANGKELKAQSIGVGADGNNAQWTLSPANLPAAGDYTLHATSEPGPVSLPSGGLAHFNLYAALTY